jgi:hypothetical protein
LQHRNVTVDGQLVLALGVVAFDGSRAHADP